MLTVEDFIYLMCDDSCYIKIWNLDQDEVIYDGEANDLRDAEILEKDIISFDFCATENPWAKAAIEINIED